MKSKKGFTLMELLAVIVILAIIALIATPIVLNIINNSKKSSIRESAELYLTAVEQSVAQKLLKNKDINYDGTYVISDNGKTLTNGEIELKPSYNGIGIETGTLKIQNGKVTKIGNGKIDKWYAVIKKGKVELVDEIPSSILVIGDYFNSRIRSLANTSIITHMYILSNGNLPEGYTKEELEALENVSVSEDNKVKAYIEKYQNENNEEKAKIYVYSENQIYANKNSSNMFRYFSSLIELDITQLETSKVTDMGSMFERCSSLTKLDLSNFDTSKVTDMYKMFANCSSLTELDVSNFDTSNVTKTEMIYMFSGCSSLTELDVSNFDTSKVTNMSSMFSGCSSLTELDVSNFDTSKVTDMHGMFASCSSLTKLDVTNFDTSNVTNMSSMFSGCSSLTELDVSNFDTSKVTDMSSMFYYSDSLTELDLSSFDTSKVTDMSSMFHYCKSLKEITVSDKWVIGESTKTSTMFYGCGTDHVTVK